MGFYRRKPTGITYTKDIVSVGLSLFSFLAISAICSYSQTAKAASASETREPQAEAILRRSIDKLGRLQQWANTNGLRVIGTVLDGEKNSQVVWEDHWSGHYKMVRHTKTGDNDNKYLQNPDRNKSTSQPDSSQPRKMRPEFDRLSTLITHAPGSAIALALNDPHYGLAIVHPQIKNAQNLDCVRINKNALGVAHTNVTLCLTHDGIPQQVMIELANVKTQNQPIYETVNYSGYTNVQGQLFPAQIAMKSPLGRERQYSFQSYTINPVLDTKDFEESGK